MEANMNRAKRDRRVADMPANEMRAIGVLHERRSGVDRRAQQQPAPQSARAAGMNNPIDMSDIELLAAIVKTQQTVSYHNAAEGQQWYAEERDREAAQARLRELTAESARRGAVKRPFDPTEQEG
jgi:hypothetical protein